MITLFRPSDRELRDFAARMPNVPLSYPEVGATREDPPPGYHVDRSEVVVGRGGDAWSEAKRALARYAHYDGVRGRVRIVEPRPPFEEGSVVVLLGNHFGLWTLSACRIVYTIDEPRRFGFAYGTLEHAVRGEELFELVLGDDDSVRFRLLAFSVPDALVVRLGAPLARHFQRRAGRDYGDALRAAIDR